MEARGRRPPDGAYAASTVPRIAASIGPSELEHIGVLEIQF